MISANPDNTQCSLTEGQMTFAEAAIISLKGAADDTTVRTSLETILSSLKASEGTLADDFVALATASASYVVDVMGRVVSKSAYHPELTEKEIAETYGYVFRYVFAAIMKGRLDSMGRADIDTTTTTE